jgi:hypothetical protein
VPGHADTFAVVGLEVAKVERAIIIAKMTAKRETSLRINGLTNFQREPLAVGNGIMPLWRMFEVLVANRNYGFTDLAYEIHTDDPMPRVVASFAYTPGASPG